MNIEQGMMNIEVERKPFHFIRAADRIHHSLFSIRHSIILLLLPFLFSSAAAQSLQPRGYFSADTLKIGEPVDYTLTFRYPRDLEVVFPNESARYAPFEYLDRRFFPTRSDSLYSYDSVVYQLTTFELDSVQPLTLPVYVIDTDEGGQLDSTAIYAAIDSIYLQQVISQLPDSVALRENTEAVEVSRQFNYPYWLLGAAALLLLLAVLYALFGKQLRRRWQLRRLRRANRQFAERFAQAMVYLKTDPSAKHSEEALVVWKHYMERLDRAPYTKMTTREIAALPAGAPLRDDLRAIDRSIYGKKRNGELAGHFEQLRHHTERRFAQRIEEVKHG
ncbi:MAG: hypothetical protein WA958_21985 [Tunicatimonas sp.]